jgi:hypothetical protein
VGSPEPDPATLGRRRGVGRPSTHALRAHGEHLGSCRLEHLKLDGESYELIPVAANLSTLTHLPGTNVVVCAGQGGAFRIDTKRLGHQRMTSGVEVGGIGRARLFVVGGVLAVKRRVDRQPAEAQGVGDLVDELVAAIAGGVLEVTYVLDDPFIQNGGRRRLGHSELLFIAIAGVIGTVTGDLCGPMETLLHDRYGFDLMVRAPLERLALLAELRGFEAIVAPLPIVSDSFPTYLVGVGQKGVRGRRWAIHASTSLSSVVFSASR